MKYTLALIILLGATNAYAQLGGSGGSGPPPGSLPGYSYGVDKPTFAMQPVPGGNKLVSESKASVGVFLQPCHTFEAGMLLTGPFAPAVVHDVPPFTQCPVGGQTKDMKVEVVNPPAGRYISVAWMSEVSWDQWGNKLTFGFVSQKHETTLP